MTLKTFLTLCATFLLSIHTASAQTFIFGTKTNPRGETIEVDSKGIIINGRHTLPVMGEIHYARVPEREWRREIQKMKAGGITIIATYCFWIHHEPEEGRWDWNGNRNLSRFLDVCREEGMPVVLRIGPFCHGEVYQGGMPSWIVEKAQKDPKNFKLRSMAPGFIAATTELYRNIFLQAAGKLWKDGGPVVGVQIENECRGPWAYYMTLKDIAVGIGFDTPFYTRTGWPKLNGKEEFGKLLPLYGDYADGFWDRKLTDMPGDYPKAFVMKDARVSGVIATETFGTNQDTRLEAKDLQYPYLTCELGGGMMPAYHRRINITGNEILPLATCKLGSGSNLPGYYMYHGGTNPEGNEYTMAETQASAVTNYNDMPLKTYDFQAPLGEMGQPNFKAFHSTRLLHQFLADWGEQLAMMKVDSLSEHYARRGCFEFYNDYVRILNEDGVCYVRPVDMPWKGHRITADAQPFCHIGDTLYFIPIKGKKPVVWIDGKAYKSVKGVKRVKDIAICILSDDEAQRAFKIDDKMTFAAHDGGILFKDNGVITEEYWTKDNTRNVKFTLNKRCGEPRTIKMGSQKVAAMPDDKDFEAAQVYIIDIPTADDNTFIQINYQGDCARVYADGKLVEDNFWNGKPMLVRTSELEGKRVELKILPLRKDAPIYLQKQQRDILQATEGSYLLKLLSIDIIRRNTERHGATNDIMNLAGTWKFRIDRNDEGEKGEWYMPDFNFDDEIRLPASMPQRMKGDDISVNTRWTGAIYDSSYYHNPFMEQYRKPGKDMKLPFFLTPDKYYTGKAWYKTTVNISKADKRQFRLFMERPHIASTLWVNGKRIGSDNSLSVPHIYDLADALTEGENTIAVCIDNDPKAANVGQDSHSITDQTQGNWNGIVGRIELQPVTYIDSIKVYPDVDKRNVNIRLVLRAFDKDEDATVSVGCESFNTDKRHSISIAPVAARLVKGNKNTLVLNLDMGDGMLLWDEFNPQLYRLNVDVKTKDGAAHGETVFGMRKMEIRDKMFYVNGRQTILRGTVESCCFPNTGYPPTDLESWRAVFETCKKWGLNHVRFHSYCPPEAAFLAADLTGVYIQPEGPSWPNHGVKLGRGEFIDDYLICESKRIADEYGNHPSFAFFAFGNEPAGNWVKWCNEMMPVMQQYDPRHLYAGFSVGGGWAWQPKTEFAVKAGARGLSSWNKRHPESEADFSDNISIYKGKDMPGTPITIPFVSHETGQWCAFPNFDEIGKYTGVNKARNFEIFRDLLKANGMESRGRDFLMASGKLQALCYKYELERHLRTPKYAGFQLLALNDYSGQGSALVGLTDVFFGDKGYISAPEFREFCSPIVPLAKFGKFTYTTDETFNAEISLAQFSDKELRDAKAHWEINCGNNILAKGDFDVRTLPVGQNIPLGNVSVPLSGIAKAGKYTLTVSIPGTEARNHWDFWVYDTKVCDIPQKTKDYEWNGIYITDSLTAKAQKILDKGGKVLILAAGKVSYGKEVKQNFTPVFWNTSWFKMRPPHTTGIFVESMHPVFSDFPTDSHSDLQWWELVNGAQVMQLTDFPKDFQPLVQSIDTWFVSRKIGMLIEANVGKGRLMMTTMDLTSDLAHRHVARQMFHSILRYMQSDAFTPQWTIDSTLISDLFTKVAGEVNMFTNDSPDELKPKLR